MNNMQPAQFVRRVQAPANTARPYWRTSRKVEQFRQGYPRLAAFVDSDKDFAVFRTFGRLHARILLDKQDKISLLEEELDDLDDKETTAYHLSTRRHDENKERQVLLQKIGSALYEYSGLLDEYLHRAERPRASKRSVQSVDNWLESNKPIVEDERMWLKHSRDLICPSRHADESGLDNIVEDCVAQLIKRGLVKRNTEKSVDHDILLFPHITVMSISRLVTTVLASTALITPIVVLYFVPETTTRIWIIALFTLVFSSVLCTLTQSRTHEIYSATAAYCAVMVVFVGSLPEGTG